MGISRFSMRSFRRHKIVSQGHLADPLWREYLVFLLLAVFVLFSGGASERWGQVVFLLGVAFLYLVSLPREMPGCFLNFCFLFLALVPLCAFLPGDLALQAPHWKKELLALGMGGISSFISPQPRVTLDFLPSYYGGLALVWWVLCQNPDNHQRRLLLEIFAIAGSVLAVVSLLARFTHSHFFWWPADGTMGPFQGRNQMATFLAILSVLLICLIHSDWRRKRKSWIFWLPALALTFFAIIVNYSRAGVLLFGFGIVLYGAILALCRRRIAIFSVCLAALLVFTAAFFLGGGKTLSRFWSANGRSLDLTEDYRFLVQKDARKMIGDDLLFGTGLGNFDAVFPLYRDASAADFRTWHPESDWLWLAADFGFPALIVAVAAVIAVILRLGSGLSGQVPVSRIGGMVACAQFLLHSFFDVSGHDLGDLMVLCLALLLCWPGPRTFLRTRAWSVAICLALAVMAVFWLSGLLNPEFRMGMFGGDFWMEKASGLRARGKYADAQKALDRARVEVPLGLWVHYLSARNQLAMGGSPEIALREFRIASRLEPFSPITEEDAARDWLLYGASNAPEFYIRALERSYPRASRIGRYELYLRETQAYPMAMASLLQYGEKDLDLLVIRLAFLPQKDFEAELPLFAARHGKNLDKVTLPRLFQLVEARSGTQGLEALKQLPDGLVAFARALARKADFRQACTVIFKNQPLSESGTKAEKETAYQQWKQSPTDPVQGAKLMAHLSVPEDSSTIEELAGVFGTRRDVPPMLYYLQARVAAHNGHWEAAWRSLDIYLQKSTP